MTKIIVRLLTFVACFALGATTLLSVLHLLPSDVPALATGLLSVLFGLATAELYMRVDNAIISWWE